MAELVSLDAVPAVVTVDPSPALTSLDAAFDESEKECDAAAVVTQEETIDHLYYQKNKAGSSSNRVAVNDLKEFRANVNVVVDEEIANVSPVKQQRQHLLPLGVCQLNLVGIR
jgi:hypothetical protein